MDEPTASDPSLEGQPVMLDEPTQAEVSITEQGEARQDVAGEYTAMVRVSAWAKTFSWLILVIGGAYVLFNLYRFVRSVASAGAISQIPVNDLLSGALGVFYSVLQVGFFVLVLRGISEIIDFLLDRWL